MSTQERKKRIAVIGSAGRGADAAKMTPERFQWMCADFARLVQDELHLSFAEIEVLSGGAAFADHIAVEMARRHKCDLALFLPAAWDMDATQYVDTGVRDWRTNPGGTSNYYHRVFAQRCQVKSLAELQLVIGRPNTRLVRGNGFFERNNGIAAQADVLVAYTFGEDAPSSSGTLRTWRAAESTAQRIHRQIQ